MTRAEALITTDVGRAADRLCAGGLVAFPTETVYGLGADATNDDALRRLYAVKGRPAAHPVIVHVASADRLDDLAESPPPYARVLAAAFWPGPLTLVVGRRRGTVSDRATGGRDTVGVRVPDHPLALDLLARVGRGVAAPSANRFGCVSPTTAPHVVAGLDGDVDLVLDGGPCRIGVESTIVDCSTGAPRVLRLGGITVEELRAVLGTDVATGGATAAPGTLPSHYAPKARVEMVAAGEVAARAAELARSGRTTAHLGLEPPDGAPASLLGLARPRDVDEYARVLYARMREADERGVDVLLVVPPPARGIGAAVVDRLHRAARGTS